MKATILTTRIVRWFRIGLGCGLLLAVSLSAAYSQRFDKMKMKPGEDKFIPFPERFAPVRTAKLPVEPGAVEVSFTDGSNLKLILREEKLALVTPHGKLSIAVADIQRIEFATRVSEEDAKRIHAAIVDLGSTEFSKRETASAELLKLREKGYPELLRAAENKDLEVVRRAKELIQQIDASVPAEQLRVRPKDVVYTEDSMIAGRIEGVSLKAHTSQFGTVQLRLADARSLRSQKLQPQTSFGMNSGTNLMGNPNAERERMRRQMQMQMMQQRQWMDKAEQKK
jgi:hypothetical protein